MNGWFSSLRQRLIASHLLVILITILLTLGITGGVLRRYESTLEDQRIKEIAAPLTLASALVSRNPNTTIVRREALDNLADENDVRVLFFEPDGLVVYDSQVDGNLEGQILDAYSDEIINVYVEGRDQGQSLQVFAEPDAVDANPLGSDRLLLSVPGTQSNLLVTGVAAPERRYPILRDNLPQILVIAGISTLVASLVGYLLSKRLAAPITRLTEATKAMGAGNYAQQVPGEGPDELGRLVRSFNEMSTRVADTDASQRALLADVAHELRTPLTSVQGYAQAIQDGVIKGDADTSRAVSVIRHESERMGELISQLLELARLESRQLPITPELVQMKSLVGDLADRFQPTAVTKQVELVQSIPEDAELFADPDRVMQMLSNLVANAIRHTPAGGSVTISAVPSANGVEKMAIMVADTGEGIAPSKLPHLFDRFYRGEPQGVDGDGFGLGLAIVKELADQQSGSVSVESKLGEGTTFTVCLPQRDGLPTS